MQFIKNVLRYLFFIFIIRPFVLFVLGINVSGAKNLPKIDKGPSIIVANHNSHVDTLLLMSLFSGSQNLKIHPIVARDYFFDTKIKKFFFETFFGAIAIDRIVKKMKKEDFFKEINNTLKDGATIIIYPEGTRGNDNSLNEFKTGVAHIAKMNPEVPVIPFYINGPDRIAPKGSYIWIPFIADIYIAQALYWDNTNVRDFCEKIKASVEKLKNEHKKKEEL